MQIKIDDLTGPEIQQLLQHHLDDMEHTALPESRHALDLSELLIPEITVWTIWDDDQLVGCGALKELDAEHAEVKSMRTAKNYLRRGVAQKMLLHIIQIAKERNCRSLSLETGSMAYFEPARAMYEKHGFIYSSPFADYAEDPNSVFMSLTLRFL